MSFVSILEAFIFLFLPITEILVLSSDAFSSHG